ncbi:MAG TPA: hypothetical protein ENN80_02770, partial [Candidatus Hydrogenedentes bacterium]|nr:hypothetical protein [Candidatus Hydrogenedentota bacterium]
MRRVISGMGLLVLVASLAGCPPRWETEREVLAFTETLGVGGHVTVINERGQVRIEGWDQDSVEVSA